MKASFFMRKRKLLITRFMQYIFLAVLERNLPPPSYCFPPKIIYLTTEPPPFAMIPHSLWYIRRSINPLAMVFHPTIRHGKVSPKRFQMGYVFHLSIKYERVTQPNNASQGISKASITYSKLTIKPLKQVVKYVQS